MYTESRHSRFSLTPLAHILEDGANACRGVGDGIETYPLCDHVMQSLFLRMTGALEQKMKCLGWELATEDYDFRRFYLNDQKMMGEYSNYNSKNILYNQILKSCGFGSDCHTAYLKDARERARLQQLKQKKEELEARKNLLLINSATEEQIAQVGKEIGDIITRMKEVQSSTRIIISTIEFAIDNHDRETILNSAVKKTQDFARTIWGYGDERGRLFFGKTVHLVINKDDFGKMSSLFEKNLQGIYTDIVYNHRNRCAHNTTSYQGNLPSFDSLAKDDYPLWNYYFRFTILLLIDEVFRLLYHRYQEERRMHLT